MAFSHFVTFSLLLAAAFAGIAHFDPCPNVSPEQCTVTEVRIDPCDSSKKYCTLKKAKNASISFDFTPNFVASKLKVTLVWPSPSGEIPFAGMNTDNGCDLTTCPTVSGSSQTLDYTLYIGKMLPKGDYKIRWRVFNEENEIQMCCFEAEVHLRK